LACLIVVSAVGVTEAQIAWQWGFAVVALAIRLNICTTAARCAYSKIEALLCAIIGNVHIVCHVMRDLADLTRQNW